MPRKPVELTPKELDQIRIMAGLGMPIDRIAKVLGISESTLYRRKRLVPEIQEAIDKGTALAEYSISKTLYDMATSDRNLSALIWWEKTRFNRSERATVQHEIKDEVKSDPVVIYIPDNGRDEVKVKKGTEDLPMT